MPSTVAHRPSPGLRTAPFRRRPTKGEVSRSETVRVAGARNSGLAGRDQQAGQRGTFPAPAAAHRAPRHATAEVGHPAHTGSADVPTPRFASVAMTGAVTAGKGSPPQFPAASSTPFASASPTSSLRASPPKAKATKTAPVTPSAT